MRRWLVAMLALAAAAVAPASAQAAKRPHGGGPSAARIHRAVTRAEHSRYLWATVNVCDRSGRGGVIGVRGEMPALGFASTLAMTIHLNQYSTNHRAFQALPGATAEHMVALGPHAAQVHQGGAEFPFSGAAGLLDASVTFTWTRGATVLGRVTRTTTGGHPQAAFGRPAHHSAAQCRLG